MATPVVNLLDFICILTASLVAIIAFQQKQLPTSRNYPPGPRGIPLLGNLLQLPSQYQWITFSAWSKRYRSDIVHARVLGQSIVVLNSFEAASELLESRSSIYSDRPDNAMLQDVLDLGRWSVPFIPYGSLWRTLRQKFHVAFSAKTIQRYKPLQIELTGRLLKDLAEAPQDYRRHINVHPGRIILRLVYGSESEADNNEYIHTVDENFRLLNEDYKWGNVWLVDVLPALKYLPSWLPGLSFHNTGKRFRSVIDDMVNKPFNRLKNIQKDADLQVPPCLVSQELERLQETSLLPNDSKYTEEETLIKWFAAASYPAAQDTTSSAIGSFILAMTLHPEYLKIAQEEIRALTQDVRLPSFEDKAAGALPFIHCICLEVIRWNPAVPAGVMHRVTEDDEYKGYHIPKGAWVIGNSWAILHDESVFPDPFRFDPTRYLRSEDGKPTFAETRVMGAAFGFGRRICPGRWFALETLWLTIAQFAAVFDVVRARDKDGKEIVPEPKFSHGLNSHAAPFECRIVPRSPEALKLLDD
ncbi:cytochrome P450 [Pterulicium gracile]|uniref:Cytochrome P450 n=1 Tax=Pterulicium gracile TaxID=1884261 RepID=A0A5C3R380_9AGAR|nr:cytochrome P450 [Pterula gracilis]